MRKGISPILVSVFLVIIAVVLSFSFLTWTRTTQEAVQEDVEREVEQEIKEVSSGLSIVEVSGNVVSVRNTGNKVIDTGDINVLVGGKVAESRTPARQLGPDGVVGLEVFGFVPGVKEVRVTGPAGTVAQGEEAIMYPGSVAFWDFLPRDEGTPRDAVAENDGKLFGSTKLLFHMAEGSGDVLNDATSYDNDGLLKNNPSWTSGVSGNALEFDGDDDLVDVEETELPSGGSDESMTVAFWVNPDSQSGSQNRVLGIEGEWTVSIENGGEIWFRTWGSNNGGTAEILDTGEWQHVTVTWDVGSEYRIYVDGELWDAATSGDTSTDTGNNFQLGQTGGSPFTGGIDEVEIHDRALSPGEINTRVRNEEAMFADYVPGIFNAALQLDGQKNHVEVPDSADLDIFEGLTIETWVNVGGTGPLERDGIVSKNGSYALHINTTAGVSPEAQVQVEGGKIFRMAADDTLPIGEWQHLVFTAGDHRMKLYVNGSLAAEQTYGGQIAFTETPLLIGAKEKNPLKGTFEGEIDYVGIYDRVLSPETVGDIYEAGRE